MASPLTRTNGITICEYKRRSLYKYKWYYHLASNEYKWHYHLYKYKCYCHLCNCRTLDDILGNGLCVFAMLAQHCITVTDKFSWKNLKSFFAIAWKLILMNLASFPPLNISIQMNTTSGSEERRPMTFRWSTTLKCWEEGGGWYFRSIPTNLSVLVD